MSVTIINTCAVCGDPIEYTPHIGTPSTLCSDECRKLSHKKNCARWYAKNKNHVQKKHREWYDENRQSIIDRTLRNAQNSREKRALYAARNRAKRRGLEFTITVDDIQIPEKCPVLGIPLTFEPGRGAHESSPSIDRIDNTKGYTPDNIVIISWRANRLKSDATMAELKAITHFYKEERRDGSQAEN